MYPLIHTADAQIAHFEERTLQLIIDHQVLFESTMEQEHLVVGAYICADQSLLFYKQFDLSHAPYVDLSDTSAPYYTHRQEFYLSPSNVRCLLACLKINEESPRTTLLNIWARFGGQSAFERVQQLCDRRNILGSLSSVVINRRCERL